MGRVFWVTSEPPSLTPQGKDEMSTEGMGSWTSRLQREEGRAMGEKGLLLPDAIAL